MAQIYNPRVATSGLIMYLDAGNTDSYPGSGATWRDLSGNGINGTLQGSPTFSQEGNGCFNMNGSTQYITTNHATNYPTAFTFGSWVYINPSQVQAYPKIVSKNSDFAISQSDFPFAVAVNSSVISVNCSTGADFTGQSILNKSHNSSNKWAYVAVTLSQTALNLYVNGAVIGTTTYATTTFSNSSYNWTFCRAALEYAGGVGASAFTGKISNIQMYNRTLSAAEISSNFSALRGRYGV